MESPIRVIIADDHALFRQGLKSLLRLQPEIQVVAELERVADVAGALEAHPCDILLLDLEMERSAVSDIESLGEKVAVVVVTASERAEDALAAIRAGARGLVFKRFAIESLMTAIHAVIEGGVWLPPSIQMEVATRLRDPAAAALTRREREIVRNVALGMRNAEVASLLGISEVTVKTHLNNIFQKLEVRDRVTLTLHAIRMGIVGVNERRR